MGKQYVPHPIDHPLKIRGLGIVVVVVPDSSSVGFTRVCDVAFVTHAVFASSGDDDADSGERARD